MAIEVRDETPSDYAAIRRVTVDAFSNCPLGHHGEADLIDTLRSEASGSISLVAFEGEAVIGHVLFTPASVILDQQEFRGMAVGPMSVVTERQKSGVGTALLKRGLDRLSQTGVPFVVVIGHAEYYCKFGFQSASALNLVHGFESIPQKYLFVRGDLTGHKYDTGKVHFHDGFGSQF